MHPKTYARSFLIQSLLAPSQKYPADFNAALEAATPNNLKKFAPFAYAIVVHPIETISLIKAYP